MKTLLKYALATLITAASSTAYTQTNEWNIISVKGNNNSTLGHMVYVNSIGIKNDGTQSPTSLRVVCSTDTNKNKKPYLVVMWENMSDKIDTPVLMQLDNQLLPESWVQNGTIIYVPYSKIGKFATLAKTGHSVTIQWYDRKNIKYHTSFPLNGYSSVIDTFYTKCGL